MSEIKVLSKEVSELIAAGEVIDRPASVVKELLENAVDAGANVITVEIKNGGRTYLRVTDNGKGISAEDLPTAFLRHATSKITDKNDLEKILTLGFRGEALASICAVARVNVLTKRVADELGTHYEIEGGEEKVNEQSGCPDGTTFVVRDLFYNVPARLKFLKKDTTEGNYVAEIVTKLTLSHPEISFKFIRDNKVELLSAGDGKTYSAVYSVFGREFASSLVPVDYTWKGIHIGGFTVRPLESKSNRKFQNFFVNSRYIKSLACSCALEDAYRNQIMVGKFPACVLYIDIAPDTVDVNVHPTKIQVRFSNESLMHEAVYFAVKDALLKNDKPNEIKFESKRNFTDKELYSVTPDPGVQMRFAEPAPVVQPKQTVESAVSVQPASPVQSLRDSYDAHPVHATESVSGVSETQSVQTISQPVPAVQSAKVEPVVKPQTRLTVEEVNRIVSEIPLPKDEDDGKFRYIADQSFEKKQQQPVVIEDHTEKPKPVVIGELFRTFVVAQCGDEMILMDKHAAHERYIFEKIKDDKNQLDPQMLLEPVMVVLAYDEYDALSQNVEKVRELGFEIEPDVAPTIAVKGVPIILGDENPSEVISELAKNFIANKLDPQIELFDDLYHSLACKAAIKAHDKSSIVELQALLDKVYDNDDIRYCPHGRPVMIKLSKREIEKQFKRIV